MSYVFFEDFMSLFYDFAIYVINWNHFLKDLILFIGFILKYYFTIVKLALFFAGHYHIKKQIKIYAFVVKKKKKKHCLFANL